MAIYTKTGDKGETSLASGERISKADARIEAYGTVDELNSWVGALRAEVQRTDRCADRVQNIDRCADSVQTELEWIQNKLFNLGAALSAAPGEWITEVDVKRLEEWIDAMQEIIPKQRAFILPAGGEVVTRCHICRTICRRAERRMLVIQTTETELRFINRLSDCFFVLARYFGHVNGEKEAIWCKN